MICALHGSRYRARVISRSTRKYHRRKPHFLIYTFLQVVWTKYKYEKQILCRNKNNILIYVQYIGFHQKMQIMDWLEIRYLSSFLFLKNFFYFQNRLRLCCVQCWWARIKVEMLSCLLFPQLDCLDVELCHVSHFSLGGTHVTWAPPKKSKNFWWGHLFTESYQPW